MIDFIYYGLDVLYVALLMVAVWEQMHDRFDRATYFALMTIIVLLKAGRF